MCRCTAKQGPTPVHHLWGIYGNTIQGKQRTVKLEGKRRRAWDSTGQATIHWSVKPYIPWASWSIQMLEAVQPGQNLRLHVHVHVHCM